MGDGRETGTTPLSAHPLSSQAAPSIPAPGAPVIHPHSQSTSALRLSRWGQGTLPVSQVQGLSQQPGITWGDTWPVGQQGTDLPPRYPQPPAICDGIRTHRSRKVFGFTVALDQKNGKTDSDQQLQTVLMERCKFQDFTQSGPSPCWVCDKFVTGDSHCDSGSDRATGAGQA